MHDPVAAGRRAAYCAIAVEAAASGLVALAFLLQGSRHALAALVGGFALVAGHLVAARLALGGGIVPARVAFVRLLLGVTGKWLLIVVVLVIASKAWHLPPLPMLVGLLAGLVAWFVTLYLQAVRQTSTSGNKRES